MTTTQGPAFNPECEPRYYGPDPGDPDVLWVCTCDTTDARRVLHSKVQAIIDYETTHRHPELAAGLAAQDHTLTTVRSPHGTGLEWSCACGATTTNGTGYATEQRARQSHTVHIHRAAVRWLAQEHDRAVAHLPPEAHALHQRVVHETHRSTGHHQFLISEAMRRERMRKAERALHEQADRDTLLAELL